MTAVAPEASWCGRFLLGFQMHSVEKLHPSWHCGILTQSQNAQPQAFFENYWRGNDYIQQYCRNVCYCTGLGLQLTNVIKCFVLYDQLSQTLKISLVSKTEKH